MDRKGSQVWAAWPESSSLEEATSYLLGPVLGILLRYRGVISLHASSVGVEGSAIAFAGPPGAGKSTAAAALGQLGCRILADDITALEERSGQFFVNPAYPGVNLWPDSVEFLHQPNGARLPQAAAWEKRCLSGQDGLQFEDRPLPLKRIFVLGDRKDSHSGAEPSIPAGMPSQERLLSLISNTYATNILDARMRADELIVLARLASTVDVLRLDAHPTISQLKQYCTSA
jgi:hypothetical protein